MTVDPSGSGAGVVPTEPGVNPSNSISPQDALAIILMLIGATIGLVCGSLILGWLVTGAIFGCVLFAVGLLVAFAGGE